MEKKPTPKKDQKKEAVAFLSDLCHLQKTRFKYQSHAQDWIRSTRKFVDVRPCELKYPGQTNFEGRCVFLCRNGECLSALYGFPLTEANLAILMRHRAVLLGILGFFLLYAAFRPALQPLAFLAGFASLLSFLWIAWSIGGYNESIRRTVIVDTAAWVSLVVGVAIDGI